MTSPGAGLANIILKAVVRGIRLGAVFCFRVLPSQLRQ
jgi:hypothetical protein